MRPHFLLLATMLAGWFNRRQQAMIGYLQEENRVLREQCERAGRLRLTDEQRARLARKGKALPWAVLAEAVTLVTPQPPGRGRRGSAGRVDRRPPVR